MFEENGNSRNKGSLYKIDHQLGSRLALGLLALREFWTTTGSHKKQSELERQPPIAMRLNAYVGFHVSNADAFTPTLEASEFCYMKVYNIKH